MYICSSGEAPAGVWWNTYIHIQKSSSEWSPDATWDCFDGM